jgi:hypothetical protein
MPKKNRSSETSLERVKPVAAYALAHASAQETPIIMHTHLSASQKIRNSGNGLVGALRAGTHSQDKIAQGQSRWPPENLLMLFHRMTISGVSRFNAVN